MSRIGRNPVVLPDGVEATLKEGKIAVKGPKGNLEMNVPELVEVSVQDKTVVVKPKNGDRHARAQHGLVRALIQNMVTGVTKQFIKELEIKGVGYRADVKGSILQLSLGFSHPVKYAIPEGVKISVKKQTEILIEGCDKKTVGQTAAEVRGFRPPEPYQGKGIRGKGEYVRRKVGKAAAGAGGGT